METFHSFRNVFPGVFGDIVREGHGTSWDVPAGLLLQTKISILELSLPLRTGELSTLADPISGAT
jgi:hypothetical protein